MGSIAETHREPLAGSAGRLRHLRAALFFAGAAALSLLLPRVEHPEIYLIAAAMSACWIVPLWYAWSRGTLDLFEPIHAVGFIYIVYFGLGAIWTVNDPVDVAFDRYVVGYVPIAAVYCTMGYVALLAGYTAPWYGIRLKSRPALVPTSWMFLIVPGVIGLIGYAGEIVWARTFKFGISVSSLVGSLPQLAPLFLFSWALVWLLYFSGRGPKNVRFLLFAGFVPAAAAVMLLSLHDKSLAMTLVGVPIIALWYARHKVPWLFLVALLLVLIFVIFPVYNTFRTLDPRVGDSKRAEITYVVISHWDAAEYFDRSFGTFKLRMALINSVATVVRDTGRWVPYEAGRTLFLPTLVYFIPRVLWADKPLFTMGREFGETFRLVHTLDDNTSVAATVPGELYWNFGLPGILIGMAVGGVLIRLLYRRYGEGAAFDPVRKAIYIVVFVALVHYGGGIAGQTVMAVRTLLILELFCFVARRVGLLGVEGADGRSEQTA